MMASRSPSDAVSMSGLIERESGATSYKQDLLALFRVNRLRPDFKTHPWPWRSALNCRGGAKLQEEKVADCTGALAA